MRILIAEDDKVIADGLCRSLRQSGYAVDHEMNGVQTGLSLATNFFDLLILDLSLPEMTGLQVLLRLRKHNSLDHVRLARYTEF